ncbi:MAG TPA: hypothetical protein VF861_16040 [Telluria sp.]
MPIPDFLHLLKRASRALGLETIDSFPPGHAFARTRWDRAWFDIASDMKPDRIERTLCEAIANTPAVFARIVHPTPRMQRTLLAAINAAMRRSSGAPLDLVGLLIDAYRSPYTVEAIRGLRAAIAQADSGDGNAQAHAVLAFLGSMPAAFDVIEAQT